MLELPLGSMVKLGMRKTKGSKNYFITIPIDIIDSLGWDKGNDLLVSKVGDKICIERITKEKS